MASSHHRDISRSLPNSLRTSGGTSWGFSCAHLPQGTSWAQVAERAEALESSDPDWVFGASTCLLGVTWCKYVDLSESQGISVERATLSVYVCGSAWSQKPVGQSVNLTDNG